MRSRCHDQTAHNYYLYGARGITVCPEWRDDFWQFADDMGECPDGHQLARIDNDGDYEPSNCRWVTRKASMRNRRNNKYVTFQGRRMVQAEAIELAGIGKKTFFERVGRQGWSVEKALNTPVRAKSRPNE